MIPRAIEMIFRETQALKELGWQYAMTGQFVEIYNEKVGDPPSPQVWLGIDGKQINDLFGNDSFDVAKHEVRHEGTSTSVTGIVPCKWFPTACARRLTGLQALWRALSRSRALWFARVGGVQWQRP